MLRIISSSLSKNLNIFNKQSPVLNVLNNKINKSFHRSKIIINDNKFSNTSLNILPSQPIKRHFSKSLISMDEDDEGVSIYLERHKHYRAKDLSNISNAPLPPTLITEFPEDIVLGVKPSVPQEGKTYVKPIGFKEYFAVLDKILARTQQRGIPVQSIAVAVSGGGDSLGTAFLVKKWIDYLKQTKDIFIELHAIVVDHKMREESHAESIYTYKLLKDTMKYQNVHVFELIWNEDEKLIQRVARRKRQLIFNAECVQHGVTLFISGHHKQDNIETMIHRIAFASGINGLNGMPIIHTTKVGDATVVYSRPGLVFDSLELRATCIANGIKWVNDPKNLDLTEFRGAIRSKFHQLGQYGVTEAGFYRLLMTLGAVRNILIREVLAFFNRYVRFDDEIGFVGIYFYNIDRVPEFIAINGISAVIQYVTNRDYPVSLSSLKRTIRSSSTTSRSVGGCSLIPEKKVLFIIKDATKNKMNPRTKTLRYHDDGVFWDGRFFIQVFQYNKMRKVEREIIYSKKVSQDNVETYDNVHIPNYSGKVDTNPHSVLTVRPLNQKDIKYFLEHYPLMMLATKTYPQFLLRSFPVIEDEKGILAIPFLNFKRQKDVFVNVKFMPTHAKFVPAEIDSLYDFVKLFNKE
ncbi:hypothetical protein ABK040_014122 [Willaertia magna]